MNDLAAPQRLVLLDTDLGTDADDAVALGVLLGSPEVRLLGCTTVYGDTALRARLAKRLLHLAGRDVPVIPGAQERLTGGGAWWAGIEGSAFSDLDTEPVDTGESAPAYLATVVSEHPGEVDLVAIGPLTNVALAIGADPAFAHQVRRLWIMGGEFAGHSAEHNFKSDAEAAQIVCASGMPITVTGLEITDRVQLRPAELAGIAGAGPFGRALSTEIEICMRFFGQDWLSPCDAITVLTMLDPGLFTFAPPAKVSITVGGETAGATALEAYAAGNVTVTSDADVPAVLAAIVARIRAI